jgi:hypothetical protein
MTPSLTVPTDNIYKFACLFGLALIVSALFAFVTSYASSLDRKIKSFEVIIPLETKPQRTKTEDELLDMHKKLVEVTRENEKASLVVIAIVAAFGFNLSIYGAMKWYGVIQKRDDKLAVLQSEKLEAEIAKLRMEYSNLLAAIPSNRRPEDDLQGGSD